MMGAERLLMSAFAIGAGSNIGRSNSPDSAEPIQAAMTRRLDRLARQPDRIEHDVTIVTEALALLRPRKRPPSP